MLSRARSLHFRQRADILVGRAGRLAELFVVKTVASSLTSSVVETVAGSVSLIVVPLRHKVSTRSGVLGLVTDRVGSRGSVSSGDRSSASGAKPLTFLLSVETVAVSSTSTVLEGNAATGGDFVVPAIERSLATSNIDLEVASLARFSRRNDDGS